MRREQSHQWQRRLLTVVAILGIGGVATLIVTKPDLLAKDPPVVDKEASAHAKGLSKAFRQAAEIAVPTVVTIETKSRPKIARRFRDGENPFKGTPFEDFFNENDSIAPRMRPFMDPGNMPRTEGMGSGVIIDSKGIIVTNNHVVAGADEVTVRLHDGREFKAVEVKTDKQSDLAVVKINPDSSLPAASFGDSDELNIGDWVIAVGNPFGLEATVSAGIISAQGRVLGAVERGTLLQTDASINPGNSGGPLINLDGQIVGINTAIATNTGSFQGVGFAIPANQVKWISSQLLESGSVQRAFLGVGIGPVTPDLARKFHVRVSQGVLVNEIHPDTPAAEAGMQVGDVITSIDGHEVHSPAELQQFVERMPLDSTHELGIIREDDRLTLEVTVRPLPASLIKSNEEPEVQEEPAKEDRFSVDDLGMELADLTPEAAQQLGFEGNPSGVVIAEVSPNGVAYEAGLRGGMIISRVGRTNVKSAEEFKELMAKENLDEGVLLLIKTRSGNRFVVLKK